MIKLRAFKHNEEGAVTVETSLVLTLMMLCTGGVLECGLAFWQWNSAQQAARHGARLASVSPPPFARPNDYDRLGEWGRGWRSFS